VNNPAEIAREGLAAWRESERDSMQDCRTEAKALAAVDQK
jgi:hypothetical protein